MTAYRDFLAKKYHASMSHGQDVPLSAVHTQLFPFQRDLTVWAIRKGRAAIFADCGLGKTFIQLEFARLLGERTLILAPLSVARQTVREGHKINLDVRYVRSQVDVSGGHKLWITNYEMLDEFDFSEFGTVILDESSLLKALSGVTRRKLTLLCANVPFRLCCTATPAPNDYTELGNHAQFLGICTMAEMLSMFFINANKQQSIEVNGRLYERKGSNKGGQEWRLKHHAEAPFFKWLSSWAMTMTKPSDLGYSDEGFVLPSLTVTPTFVQARHEQAGQLFFTGLKGITDRVAIRRQTLDARLNALALLVGVEQTCYNAGYEQATAEEHTSETRVPAPIPGAAQGGVAAQGQGVPSGTQGAAEREEPRICAGPDARGEDSSEGIQPAVAGDSQGSCAGVSGEHKGQSQRTPARTLCPRPMEERGCLPTGKRLAQGESREAQGAATTRVPDDARGVQCPADEAEWQLCNLRLLGPEQSQLLPDGGSLSRDGEDSGLALRELQPCPGEVEGRSSFVSLGNCLPGEPWVIWCGLDDEQRAIETLLGDRCVSVYGILSPDEKERRLEIWLSGGAQFLVSKARVCGFGLNLQQAHKMVFLGLSDSWETYYQCIRREWRYKQESPVDVHIILSDAEAGIYQNVMRKDALAKRLRQKLIAEMRDYERSELGMTNPLEQAYEESEASGQGWHLLLGDSCERLKELEAESCHLSIYSPPFADLFCYSASDRDLGNSRGWTQFFEHYAYVIREILRVTKPGRLTCVHTSDIPAMASRDGYIGLKDFPGEVIRAYEREGWVFVGRAFVQKNPQSQAIRVKSKALLFAQLRKDSTDSRPALIDQILLFKKPGDNTVPVNPVGNGDMDNETWIEWAHGIWLGIRETDTLSFTQARAVEDEKHICLARGSLVLTVDGYRPIEDLAPGDLVLTHKGRWMPVTVIACTGVKPVVCLSAQGVPGLRLTPDHRLWTRRTGSGERWGERERARQTEPDWIPATETVANYVNLKLPPVEGSSLDAEQWWIVGRWLGDGHSSVRGLPHLSCSEQEADALIARLGEHAGAVHHTGTAVQIYIKDREGRYGGPIHQMIGKCGAGAAGKRLPKELVCLAPDLAEALLDGYLSADGHRDGLGRWQASSVSRALALGMAMVAQRARRSVASLYPGRKAGTDTIQGRIVNTRDEWVLMVSPRNRSAFLGDDGAWKKVRSAGPDGEAEVWSLAVAEDESFTAEGCIVKNCPLQLGVIERCVKLYSNPGETVLDPFSGIGSTGFVALKHRRRFVGIELKPAYWQVAVKNLKEAEHLAHRRDLFALEAAP